MNQTRVKTRKPGTFQKGNRASVGNKGGGRKPDWFKAKMRELASSQDAVDLVEGAIAGKEIDEFLVLQTGVQVPKKPDLDTRLKYLNYATEHGYGKASQPIEHSGDVGSRLIFIHPASDGDE